MSTTENHTNTSAEAPQPIDRTESPPVVTAQAIPKTTSPPPTTATPTHALPPSPTVSASATAVPIQTPPSTRVDAVPTTAQPEEPPIPPPTDAETYEMPNPRLASLSAIFPNFDSAVLESVLASVDNDEERAADLLLGMNDPNYVSNVQPAPRQTQLTQTELDEQLAHRLMLEEQQHLGPRNRRPTSERDRPMPQGNTQSGDAMDRFFDSVDKFAETGKRTLTNIFQKVKAKVDEFDSNRTNNSSGSRGNQPQPQWQGQSQTYYAPTPQPGAPPAVSIPQGYDMSSAPQPQPSEPDLQAIQPQRPMPPAATPPPNIDPSKIGMLPKRPVSLLGPQTPPRPPSSRNDEEELDYVENPFEEGRHR